MTQEEIFAIGLPKWPALVVQGKKVTKEQALEIVLRTDDFSLSSNNPDFIPEFVEEMGMIEPDEEGTWKKYLQTRPHLTSSYFSFWKKDSTSAEDAEAFTILLKRVTERFEKMKKKIGCLWGIEYIHNHQIISSYINGPHGWCSWEGKIWANTYNIGKWPSVKEVFEEWKIVAEAFPFLDLTAILYSGEHSEDGVHPVVRFRIKDGLVALSVPSSDSDAPRPEEADLSMSVLCGGSENSISSFELARRVKTLIERRKTDGL